MRGELVPLVTLTTDLREAGVLGVAAALLLRGYSTVIHCHSLRYKIV